MRDYNIIERVKEAQEKKNISIPELADAYEAKNPPRRTSPDFWWWAILVALILIFVGDVLVGILSKK